MNQRLDKAAQEGDINGFYALLGEDPKLLEDVESVPFIDTPMHTAAAAGHTDFVMEMLNLKPSFTRKLNRDGFSPIHCALRNGRVELVRRLLDIDCELVRVKGREGMTLLHCVAETGNCDLLHRLLKACPKSMEDFTSRGETILHIAVRNRMPEAVEFMVGWVRQPLYGQLERRKILNWKDNAGNAAVHLAVSTNQPQVLLSLINGDVDINATNSQGLTSLDILRSQVGGLNSTELKLLHGSGAKTSASIGSIGSHKYKSRISLLKQWEYSIIRQKITMSSDDCNALLVVAALIVTAAYQAGLGPPGGVRQDDSSASSNSTSEYSAGEAVMGLHTFRFYIAFNAAALFASVAIIILLLPFPYGGYSYMLGVALSALTVCYLLSFSIIVPSGGDLATNVVYFGTLGIGYSLIYIVLLFTKRLRNLLQRMTQ